MTDTDLVITSVVVTLTLALLVIAAVLLMVTSSNRKNRHRAEMAEMKARQDRELLLREQEATKQTLREVARELHDNLGQLFTVAQVGVKNVLEGAMGTEALTSVNDALDQGISDVRRIGHDLNSDLWEHRTLVEAITSEADRIERLTKIRIPVTVSGSPKELSAGNKTILFRVFQEILTNAIRHGKAKEIAILIEGHQEPSLTITDNGSGFETTNVKVNAGLTNIHKRCAMIGFGAVCTSTPGTGCKWRLDPLAHDI